MNRTSIITNSLGRSHLIHYVIKDQDGDSAEVIQLCTGLCYSVVNTLTLQCSTCDVFDVVPIADKCFVMEALQCFAMLLLWDNLLESWYLIG